MKNLGFDNLIRNEERALPICAGELRALHFPVAARENYLSTDREEIAARQEMFRDLLAHPELVDLLVTIRENASHLSEMVRKSGLFHDISQEELLYSFRELLLYTDTVGLIAEKGDPLSGKLCSARLKAFFVRGKEIVGTKEFENVKGWIEGLESKLRTIKSLTLGVNLNAQLQAEEIGIVSINDQPFRGSTKFERIFKDKSKFDGYTVLAPLGIRDGGITAQNALRIDQVFYGGMNDIVRRSMMNVKRHFSEEMQKGIFSLCALSDDLAFLLSGARFVQKLAEAGLPLTFPEFGGADVIKRLYDPLLLDKISKSDIVPSDVSFDDEKRSYILTGPNSGGKSVYMQSIGVAYLLFQFGLPVPASSAKMRPFDSIVTHFVEGTVQSTESRLANETARLKDSLSRLHGRALLLLDETFSGTNAYDALLLAEALMRYIEKKGVCALYITHLHELTESVLRDGEKYRHVKLLSAKIEGQKRTYEIVPYTGGHISSDFAKDVVVENGLGFLFEENG
ncbi:MAG: hypothetical protein IJU52_01590 [Clostridia bacterium]|nr:hypothetical protein [Clostridia bacterium]